MTGRATVVALAGLLIACLIAVVVLTALGDETSVVIGFIGSTIIPTAMAYLGLQEASKAKVAAGQAVENTNGILHAAVGKAPDQPVTTADIAKAAAAAPPPPNNGGENPAGYGKPPR